MKFVSALSPWYADSPCNSTGGKSSMRLGGHYFSPTDEASALATCLGYKKTPGNRGGTLPGAFRFRL